MCIKMQFRENQGSCGLTWLEVTLFFQRKAQFTCTAIFILWGVLVHLVIPPFVFMSQEGWTYVEGLYFSFVTLTTIGFGDLVAGKLFPFIYCTDWVQVESMLMSIEAVLAAHGGPNTVLKTLLYLMVLSQLNWTWLYSLIVLGTLFSTADSTLPM